MRRAREQLGPRIGRVPTMVVDSLENSISWEWISRRIDIFSAPFASVSTLLSPSFPSFCYFHSLTLYIWQSKYNPGTNVLFHLSPYVLPTNNFSIYRHACIYRTIHARAFVCVENHNLSYTIHKKQLQLLECEQNE